MKKKSTIAYLLRCVCAHSFLLVLVIISSFVAVVATLLVPILLGYAIDAFVPEATSQHFSLAFVLFLLGVDIVVVVVMQWLQGFSSSKLSYAVLKDLRDCAYRKLNTMDLEVLDSKKRGDIVSVIINDADLVGDGLLQGIQQLFSGVVTIVGTLLFMLQLSPTIALIVVLLTPLSLVATACIAKMSHTSFEQERLWQGKVSAHVEEAFSNLALITLFNQNDASKKAFNHLNAELYKVGEKAQFASSLTNPGTRFVNNITYAIVALASCLAAAQGALSIGAIQSFLSYTNQYSKPFYDITGVLTQIQGALAGAERLVTLLQEPEVKDEGSLIEMPTPLAGSIAFNDVSFAYTPSKPILKNVSWDARPTMKVAVVGKTGCGKTTMINLLMRFYTQNSGDILIDGVDTSRLSLTTLRKMFGMVLQDSWIFSGTVAQNIAFGKDDATQEEIEQAASLAHAHQFIRQLPHGYNTLLGGENDPLSEGQKQLIAIARVFLTNPKMLILDEATSSIDTRTEMLVQKALDAMMKGRTAIIVAHRLSTIRTADCILVMDEGRIVEQGKHIELLRAQGLYAQLYESQWADEEASFA